MSKLPELDGSETLSELKDIASAFPVMFYGIKLNEKQRTKGVMANEMNQRIRIYNLESSNEQLCARIKEIECKLQVAEQSKNQNPALDAGQAPAWSLNLFQPIQTVLPAHWVNEFNIIVLVLLLMTILCLYGGMWLNSGESGLGKTIIDSMTPLFVVVGLYLADFETIKGI